MKFYLMNAGGGTLVKNGRKQVFIYIHPDRCTTSNKWLPGWYFFYAEDGKTTTPAAEYKLGEASTWWAGDVEIPYGTGFGINRGTLDTTISLSGAVADADKDIFADNASGYTWMGNVMPVDYKLKDLSLVEAQGQANVKLYKMNAGGGTLVKDGRKQVFIYIHPDRCTTSNKWLPGWYFFYAEDGKTTTPAAEYKLGEASTWWAGDVDILAGEGFGINRTTMTTTLRVPSPLVDHSAK